MVVAAGNATISVGCPLSTVILINMSWVYDVYGSSYSSYDYAYAGDSVYCKSAPNVTAAEVGIVGENSDISSG